MGRVPSCRKEGVKREAWTAIEDELLVDCIKIHGEGKWSDIPKKAGLKRCGKSCRLRWMNYLRPDIKRGNMSPQEEDLIIRLHKLLGNRWSLIAGRIPGRTDNEIKNYWNTNFAKKTPPKQTSSSDKNPIIITSTPPPNPPQFTDLFAPPPLLEIEFEAAPPPMEPQLITDNVNSSDVVIDLNLREISVSDMMNDDVYINFDDFKPSDSRNIGSDCRSEASALFGQREKEVSGDWVASDCLDEAHRYYMSSDFSPLAFLFDSEAWVGDDDDSNVVYPAYFSTVIK